MRRLLYTLLILIACTLAILAQDPKTATNKTGAKEPAVSPQASPQVNKTEEDCACEWQVLPEVLGTVNDIRITRKDIEDQTKEPIGQLKRQLIEARKHELDLQINSKLVALEAARRSVSVAKLLEEEVVSKVKEPTNVQVQAFYDQNKSRMQGEFKDLKDDILQYLRDDYHRQEAKKFAERLREVSETKVQVQAATPPKSPFDLARVFAVVNGQQITSADIEDSLRPLIYDVQAQMYKLRKNELDLRINDTLLEQEAQKRKMTTNSLLDAEVKPKPITEKEALAFYEQNKDRVSGNFAETKDNIIRHLQQNELRAAELAFVEKLRGAASIETFLIEPEPPVFRITTDDQPSVGNAAALVTIVQFTDFQCPSCANAKPVLEKLIQEYDGKVRLVVRDFPLDQHSNAFKAAEAAEAAREQSKYWEYSALMLSNQAALGINSLKEYAGRLGLDRQKFDSALDSGRFAKNVQRDLWDGIRYGVESTPALFVNGRRIKDNSYEGLKAAIEAALSEIAKK